MNTTHILRTSSMFLSLAAVLLLSVAVLLVSCTSRQTYLPIEASLVQKGASIQDVQRFLGPPSAVVQQDDGMEEWYYFDDKSHFWQKIPWIGNYLGGRRVESIQLVIKKGRVVSAKYYVEKLS